MAQFDVYRLGETLVVDVQSDFIQAYGTRLVIPLVDPSEDAQKVSRLSPELTVDGRTWLLATPLTAAVVRRELGQPVASLRAHEYVIKAALDMLISGF